MRVEEWLAQHPRLPLTVEPDAEARQVLRCLLADGGRRDIYVVDRGRLVGHIDLRRLAHLLLAESRPEHTRRQLMERVVPATAREMMTSHFARARPHEELDAVLHRQLDHGVEELPVVDDADRALGVVHLVDILAASLNDG